MSPFTNPITNPCANRARCFAPASVGNVAVGFDLLGFALEGVGDLISVERLDRPEVKITQVSGQATVPLDPRQNTATVGLLKLIEDLKLRHGFAVSIEKGIALGSGMGGSAASAVGAILAANSLLENPLAKAQLLGYALAGEMAASGSAHLDNIAPCLFGGLMLAKSTPPYEVISLPVPETIRYVLVHPDLRLDTREARQVLRPQVSLPQYVEQAALLASFVAACFQADLALMGRSLKDILIEPQRAHLIPGFYEVQAAAFANAALGCSISGAGPSVFAWASSQADAERIERAMVQSFLKHGLTSDSWISGIRKKGAELLL